MSNVLFKAAQSRGQLFVISHRANDWAVAALGNNHNRMDYPAP